MEKRAYLSQIKRGRNYNENIKSVYVDSNVDIQDEYIYFPLGIKCFIAFKEELQTGGRMECEVMLKLEEAFDAYDRVFIYKIRPEKDLTDHQLIWGELYV